MQSSARRFTGPSRLARGLVLGGAVLLLTTAAHASTGAPSDVDLTSFLVLLPLSIVFSTLLADRRRSPMWLVSYLLGVQALFHVLLVVIGGHTAHAHGLVPGPAMLLNHVVAAGLAALVIAHGDRVLHRWLRFLDCLAEDFSPWPVPIPIRRPSSPSREQWARPTPDAYRCSSLLRRGPPAAIA